MACSLFQMFQYTCSLKCLHQMNFWYFKYVSLVYFWPGNTLEFLLVKFPYNMDTFTVFLVECMKQRHAITIFNIIVQNLKASSPEWISPKPDSSNWKPDIFLTNSWEEISDSGNPVCNYSAYYAEDALQHLLESIETSSFLDSKTQAFVGEFCFTPQWCWRWQNEKQNSFSGNVLDFSLGSHFKNQVLHGMKQLQLEYSDTTSSFTLKHQSPTRKMLYMCLYEKEVIRVPTSLF